MNSNTNTAHCALRLPLFRQWVCFLVGMGLWIPTTEAVAPLWWDDTWNLFSSEENADDYAAANVGQLKNFAYKAAYHMDGALWDLGGAGLEIEALLASWDAPNTSNLVRDDYAALTAGQAKVVAIKFYARLADLQAWPSGSQPWPEPPNVATDDHAVINIGQLKNLFSFEILNPNYDLDDDGMSNGFEIRHGFDYRVVDDSQGDADADGLTNLMEFWLQLDPRNTDSDGDLVLDGGEDSDMDGVTNAAEITAGTDPADSLNGLFPYTNVNYAANKQLVLKNALAPVPFSIEVKRLSETANDLVPWADLPIVFEVLSGQGSLENEAGSASGLRLIAFTDAQGFATMWFRGVAPKDTSVVRASFLRFKGLDTDLDEFTLWTSQCAIDTDDDGMDDAWEQAIINASGGALTSFAQVLPVDDFDHDGVPNVFEYDRGTDPTDPADAPVPDVILDHSGTPQGSVPVVQTWQAAVEAAAQAESDEHPETRGIIKIMPGTYNTSYAWGSSVEISRSVLLWGQSNVSDGPPVLTTTTSDYGVVMDAELYQIKYNGVLAASGLVLDGGGTSGIVGLNLSGMYLDPNRPDQDQRPWLRLTNCIIRNCEGLALNFYSVRASLDFTTVTDCGAYAQGDNAIYLYDSTLDLRNSILWDVDTSEEILIYQSGVTSNDSLIRGGAYGGNDTNPGLSPEGRLLPGSPATWLGSAAGQLPIVDIDGEPRVAPPHIGADQLADSDGDGLSDLAELSLGTSRWLTDTDGDGTPDGQDYFPLDPHLQNKTSGGGPPVIVLDSPAGAEPVEL